MPRKNPPKLTKEKTDEMGCLLMDLGFDAGEYKIFPNAHFARNMKFYEKEVNSDRFWYPPLETTWKWDPKTQKRIEKVPNSKRPANLHQIIPTHLIQRKDGGDLTADFRTNEGAMILRLLDVLYETTTQFHDWWWSGRIHLNKRNFHWLRQTDLEVLYKDAFSVWSTWAPAVKQVFLNCCFNFSRSITYEWDYERFTFLYICIDAIWWIAEKQYGVKNMIGRKSGGHANRMNAILEHLKLHENKDIVKKIVDVRSELFHEGLWGRENPMSGRDGEEYHAMRYLHEIVRRCILRIIGIQSSFVRSNWEGYMGLKLWN